MPSYRPCRLRKPAVEVRPCRRRRYSEVDEEAAPSSPCTMSTSSSRASSRRSLTTTRLNSDCASSSPAAVRRRASTCSGVGAPAYQAGAQRLAARRSDEHLECLGHRVADLTGPLDLDLQDHGLAAAQTSLHLGAEGAVTAARVGGVLHELALGDETIKLRETEKVIVDPVGLAGARRAGGGRDRQAEPGHALPQPADERPLADAGRTGDHEYSGHRRRRAELSGGAATRRARRAGARRARRASCSGRSGTATGSC